MKNAVLIVLFLSLSTLYAQRGIVTGTLEADGGPLPGANIIIKGTNKGTQTDFDGNYTIECAVGDILVIGFVGYENREIKVTPDLFGFEQIPYTAPREEVPKIQSIAYAAAIQRVKDSLQRIPSLNASPFMYTKRDGYRSFLGIKEIKRHNNIITLKYSDGATYLEGFYTGSTRLRSIANSNLPTAVINPYSTVLNTTHRAGATIWNESLKGGLSLNYGIGNDSYRSTLYHNQGVSVSFSTQGPYKFPLQLQAAYSSSTDNLANINGYQNLVLASQLTNVRFQARPETALAGNKSISKDQNLRLSLSATKDFGNAFKLSGSQSLIRSNSAENYELAVGTFLFENGYRSRKNLDNLQVNTAFTLMTDFDLTQRIRVQTTSKIQLDHTALDYNFEEAQIANSIPLKQSLRQDILEMQHNINLDYRDDVFINLSATSIVSSLQNNDLFVPQVSISAVPTSIWYGLDNGFIDYINISARYGETVSTSGLFYGNYAHQSLLLADTQAFKLLHNRDLFYTEDLALERGQSVELATEFRLFYNRVTLGFTYENRKDANGIFPVRSGDVFRLENVANTQTRGFDLSLSTANITSDDQRFKWWTEVTLSRKRTKVNSLLHNQKRVSIAGFSNVNANLIPGASAGVIVGTAFDRNSNNQIRTDDQGNPRIAEGLKIIGDPTPDFNLGITNQVTLGRWDIGITVDYQQGGDIWNGTQKALNSFSGADESYIEKATYLNLKSLSAAYELVDSKKWDNSGHLPFFNSFKVSVFANNLATSSAYRGATPYSNAFDNPSSNSIQFFNTPLQIETGFTITAKI